MENETDNRKPAKVSKSKISIKVKLLCMLLPVVICIIGLILLLIYGNTSGIILRQSEMILQTSTESVVNKVSAWMNETITALDMERDTLQYFSMDAEEELEYIKHTADRYESFPAGIYVATTDGELKHASFVPGPDFNLFEKPWYLDGLESEAFIFGSVYFDEDSQSYVVGASGVLKDAAGNTRGVAAADIYLDAISEIVQEVQLEQTGSMFLVDTNTNMIIGHRAPEMVGTALSGQADGMYQYIDEAIRSGSMGLQTYTGADGQAVYLELEQVPNSNWITVAFVPHSEVMAELNSLTTNIIVISLVGILLLVVLMERFIHFIVKPVKKLNLAIGAMTDGDFSTEVRVKTKDEIGVMADGVRNFISVMRATITEITDMAKSLNGQSDSSLDIAGSLSSSSSLQSESMAEMNKTVGELTASITEVAESATSLSLLVSETQERGKTAGAQMRDAVEASRSGRDDMEKVLRSMTGISEKINRLEQSAGKMENSITRINSIVDLIREIAEETNLLSLNASIEAARAGEAGKGFAVVADQIGKLAANSGKAVDDISALTQDISSLVGQTVAETRESVTAIQESSTMIDQTGAAFRTIYDTIQETDGAVTQMIEKVEEANSIAVNVASITEEQSAASEEILATTETMRENAENVLDKSIAVSSGANNLKDSASMLAEHMSQFRL